MPTSISMTILMGVVVLLAVASDKRVQNKATDAAFKQERLFVSLIVIALSLYAALRTKGNDTTGYIKSFETLDKNFGIVSFFTERKWESKGPIFSFLEVICKRYVSNNYHIFFLIIALITNGSIITFLRKYSCSFPVSVFLYMAMDGYGVSLTGMRQALATAIVIWSIPAVAEKKYIKYVIIMFLSYQIHFLSILYLVVPFIKKKVWSLNVVILTVLAIVATQSFDVFGELSLDVSEALGFSYASSAIIGTGVSIFRILVYMVPGIMALILRPKLSEIDTIHITAINLTVVGAGLVAIGSQGNSNTFGRFGLMFEPCMYISLPKIITESIEQKYQKVMTVVMIICFLVYYLFGLIKDGLGTNFYVLAPITALI